MGQRHGLNRKILLPIDDDIRSDFRETSKGTRAIEFRALEKKGKKRGVQEGMANRKDGL